MQSIKRSRRAALPTATCQRQCRCSWCTRPRSPMTMADCNSARMYTAATPRSGSTWIQSGERWRKIRRAVNAGADLKRKDQPGNRFGVRIISSTMPTLGTAGPAKTLYKQVEWKVWAMPLLAPISVGELLDKISILELKEAAIAAPAKHANVVRELAALEEVRRREVAPLPELDALYAELKRVNGRLWQIEDDIRE